MSVRGQTILIQLLSDTESLEYLAREGLDPLAIPNEDLRPVHEYALRYYRASRVAPTPQVLIDQFGADLFADAVIDPAGDPDETVEWAVRDLKGSYCRNETGKFTRELMTEMTEAANDERPEVVARHAARLSALAMRMQPRTTQVDMRESGIDVLAEYESTVASRGQVSGLAFGVPEIDSYTGGIRDGELAIVAAGAKTGKSLLLDKVAYEEWLRGRVAALFTLENSILMTQMRIACLHLHMSSDALQEGTLPESDVARLREWVEDELVKSDTPLLIFKPDDALRTPQSLVQMAQAYGADSMVVDQLSFLDPAERHASKKRNETYYEITRDLRVMISTGRRQMPCVLAHQINREGVKEAEKTGRVRMWHMADSSDVERIGDWVFGLYGSEDDVMCNVMKWFTLAARRRALRHFELEWLPDSANISFHQEIHADGEPVRPDDEDER